MRVLLDGRPIRRPVSGVAQYTCNLAEELGTIPDVDLNVLTLEFRSPKPHTEFALAARHLTHISRIPRKVFNIGTEHLGLPLATWICGKVDIVHHTFFGWLPVRPQARVVSTIHDVIPIEQPERFTFTNAYYSRRNFWRQLRDSDAIIAVSEFTRRKILEVGNVRDDRKIYVVPNGVRDLSSLETAGILERLRETHGIDGPFVLYVGNIEPRKGVLTLLQAFARSRSARGMQLVIAGRKCWGYEEIETQAAQMDPREIIMTGYVSEVEKAALLRAARLFVYPSTYEGFGIPVLEAMNCGCPVIAADNSSLTELCQGSGMLFETGNADDLAEKMDDLLGSQSRCAELIASGRDRAQRYTWHRAAEDTAAIYRALS